MSCLFVCLFFFEFEQHEVMLVHLALPGIRGRVKVSAYRQTGPINPFFTRVYSLLITFIAPFPCC